MKNIGTQIAIVFITMLLFAATLFFNELLFSNLQWVPGIHFVYLPAGVRLLCTLLFAEAGAIGLLLVSWLACFFYFFPNDPVRAIAGGIIASAAPYLAYRVGRHVYGVQRTLTQLQPASLLGLVTFYALVNAVLHHAWFMWQGQSDLLTGLLAMFVGDLLGSLLVLYALKVVLMRCSCLAK